VAVVCGGRLDNLFVLNLFCLKFCSICHRLLMAPCSTALKEGGGLASDCSWLGSIGTRDGRWFTLARAPYQAASEPSVCAELLAFPSQLLETAPAVFLLVGGMCFCPWSLHASEMCPRRDWVRQGAYARLPGGRWRPCIRLQLAGKDRTMNGRCFTLARAPYQATQSEPS
jgi:hypothetical protein